MGPLPGGDRILVTFAAGVGSFHIGGIEAELLGCRRHGRDGEPQNEATSEYGERPGQRDIETEGNAYLAREFPNLDFIKKASIITEDGSQ